MMLACGAMLALGACTDTKRVPVGDPMADEKLKKETDRANAAQAALNDLRDSLADVQNALKPDPSATPEQQRENLRKRLTDVETNLGMVQENLQKQPASAARTAVDTALTAVGTAVEAVKTALAPTPASGGTVSFADMHMDLDAAQAALDDAQTKITAALGADGLTDTLQTALTQAQAALTTAQVSLVPRLRSELMQAEDDAAAQKARADAEKERADTYDPRVTLGDRLTPLRKTRIDLPASEADPGSVTWTRRTDVEVTAGVTTDSVDPNPNKLEIKSDAVPYADGRLFPGPGGGQVATDEFQMRGITVRGDQLGRQPDGSTDNTINPAVMGSGAGVGGWKNYDATYESSIRMKADGSGVTLRMGGDGTIFYDMERLIALGPGTFTNQPGNGACANVDNAKCDDPTTSDVEATFGTPVADPDGEAAWHLKLPVPVNPATPTVETRTPYTSLPSGWARFTDNGEATGNTLFRVPASDDEYAEYEDEDGRYNVERAVYGPDVGDDWKPLEFRRALRIQRGRPADELGVYNLWFSNYAGVDAGAEAADPSDDTHRYLQYAAYGLFNFLDYSTTQVRYGRLQAFHFGYDAFTDDGDDAVVGANEPGGWGTAADPITATFNGKTTGWLLQSPSVNNADAPVAISRIIRLRGDVELTAKLNAGGDGHGTISGAMRDFEFLHNGVWGDDVYHRLLENAIAADHTTPNDPRPGNAVILEQANVGADGSFSGVAYAAANSAHDPDDSGPMGPGARTHNFADGTYGGAFYGPRTLGELEAAGYWRLPVATTGARAEAGTLLGSFGAKSEPEE